jgi:hypothetical protein
LLRLFGPAYVAAVALVTLAHVLAGTPTAAQVALTPDRLAAGQVWLLATSAFLINGPVIPELAGLALSVGVAQRLLGGRVLAFLAPVCHIGATLLGYAFLIVTTGDPDGSQNPHLDYGMSAVWLGILGALFMRCLPESRRGNRAARAVVALTSLAGIIGVVAFSPLGATEHGLAFGIGALVGALARPRTLVAPLDTARQMR